MSSICTEFTSLISDKLYFNPGSQSIILNWISFHSMPPNWKSRSILCKWFWIQLNKLLAGPRQNFAGNAQPELQAFYFSRTKAEFLALSIALKINLSNMVVALMRAKWALCIHPRAHTHPRAQVHANHFAASFKQSHIAMWWFLMMPLRLDART